MRAHPYTNLPDHAFWRKSLADVPMPQVDPIIGGKFRISRTDKVVTAGSCFAQHIAERLRLKKYGYFVTEPANPMLNKDVAKAANYGAFSARYGNIYTTRQLLQLFQRAHGEMAPIDDCWSTGSFLIDPFRPQIQPDGYYNRAEYDLDRKKHFAAVQRAVRELDVLVFTLGLTETWRDKRDGSTYPLAPGVAGGEFDPSIHEFHNFTIGEVVEDLKASLAFLWSHNPKARVILTVSPVPLVATADQRHVLQATTYSKSVLRVACEEVERGNPKVCYFPSFEIITGSYTRGAYFGPDLRSVTASGVDHVMRLFFKHLGEEGQDAEAPVPATAPESDNRHLRMMDEIARVNCDEEALDPG